VMYGVLLRPPAQKFLRKRRDKALTTRLIAAMRGWADNPRPAGAEKLTGMEDLHRFRIGDSRILYQVQDAVLPVLVVKLGHRREVYRFAVRAGLAL